MRTTILAAVLATATLLPAPALAQRDDDDDRDDRRQSDSSWNWAGRIPEGRWLVIRNLNGAIRVEQASGNQVEVKAVKRWRRGDPADVRITRETFGQSGESVVICALWGENAECDEDGYRSNNDNGRGRRGNDVSVEFTVRLPRGVKIEVGTVNGSVRVAGATSEVEASTVNGGVDAVSSGGPVRASTVNGDIEARMSDMGDGDLSYSTVNGSVTLELPARVDAVVDLSTVNGSLSSDYPMTLEGRVSPRRIRATIGQGGRRIKVSTVNGSVELKKL
jgi:hypothetical protein